MTRFFLPIMLGSLLQQLYSMVDAVVLGRLVGKTALAAVGGSDLAIINLVVGFFVGLASRRVCRGLAALRCGGRRRGAPRPSTRPSFSPS